MASTSEDPSLKEKEQPQEQQEQQAEQMNEEGVEHEEEVCGNCSFPAGSVHKRLIGEVRWNVSLDESWVETWMLRQLANHVNLIMSQQPPAVLRV